MILSKFFKNETCQELMTFKTVQCATCDLLFTDSEFPEHVCDYDEDKNFIGDINHETFESEVIRLLKQNSEQMVSLLRDQFKINVNKKRPTGPLNCTMCDRKFVYYAGLQRHLEKHRNEVNHASSDLVETFKFIVKCLRCGQVFSRIQEAGKHYSTHHLQGSSKQTKFLKVVSASSVLQCENCDACFTKTGDLFHHLSLHGARDGYTCKKCDISVPAAKDIVHHWQNDCIFVEFDSDRNINLLHCFVCNVCEEHFTRLEDLLNHRVTTLHFLPRLNKETGDLEIGCEKCDFFGVTVQSYVTHHNEMHNRKPINAKKQKVTSSKPRLHLCEVCGKSYTQSSHLWQHLRFHQGVKPFECPVETCDRKFTIRPDLNDHIRKCHTGERPYHCLLCGKRFLTGSVFYQHRLIHRGERRYGCEECGKRFYRADALKNHQRIHSGEKPYPCEHCTKSFRQRGDRDKHVRARHKFLPPKNISNVCGSSIHDVEPSTETPVNLKSKKVRKTETLPKIEALPSKVKVKVSTEARMPQNMLIGGIKAPQTLLSSLLPEISP